MEKDIGKIKKNDQTEIIIRVDEFKDKRGLTIREFVTSEKYTGFTRAGVRINQEDFIAFRDMINSIDYNEFMAPVEKKEKEKKEEPKKEELKTPKKERKRKKKEQPAVQESATPEVDSETSEEAADEEELAAE